MNAFSGGRKHLIRHIRNRAFTLVELLVVVTIIAIIAGIAYPSYQAQVYKSRRTDAKQSLVRLSQQIERCYSRYRRYNHIDCPQVSDSNPITVRPAFHEDTAATDDDSWSMEKHYRISSVSPDNPGISPANTESLAAETFTLYATPVNRQAGDIRCAVFQLNSTAARAAFDSQGNNVTSTCW